MSVFDKRENASSNNPLAAASGTVFEDDKKNKVTTSSAFAELLAKNASKSEIVSTLSSSDMRTGVFKWTATGLQTDGEISRDDWEQTGEMLAFMDTALQWLIGDWMLAGDVLEYGDREEFANKIGFTKETLYQYTYVARKVEFSIRIENLTFGHHQLVAAKTEHEQVYWLDQAEKKDLSVSQLRKAIKEKEDSLLDISLSSSENSLFSSSRQPKLSGLETIWSKARNGNAKAKTQVIGRLTELRKWLDDIEISLEEE